MASLRDLLKGMYDEFSDGPRALGRAVGTAVVSPWENKRLQQEQRTADLLADIGRRRQARGLPSTNYFNSAQRMTQNIANQQMGLGNRGVQARRDAITGGARTAFNVLGPGAGAKTIGATATLGGAFGGGMAKLTGGNVSEGVGRGIGGSLKYAGLNRLTAPVIDPFVAASGKLGMVGGNLGRYGARAVAHGGANFLEDQMFTRVTQGRAPTKQENLMSFAIGAATSPLIKYDPDNSFIKIVDGKIKTNPEQYRNALGRWAKEEDISYKEAKARVDKWIGDQNEYLNEKIPVYENGVLVREIKRKDAGFIKPDEFIPGKKPQSTVGGVSANPQISRPQIRPDQSMAQPQANLKVEQPPVKLQPEAKISISDPAKSLEGTQPKSSLATIIPNKDKYAFNINKERLGLKGKSAKKLDQTVKQMKPLLQKTKGKPLTDKEVIQGGRKAVMLDEVMGRDQAAQFSEQLQASRNYLKSASNEPGVTPQYLQQIEVVSSTAADAGRRLRAFAVGAEDVSIKEQVLQELKRLEVDSKEILEAAKNVDWDDAKQVTEFYRKFNPAKLTDRLEEFRYANMLSSPNTHMVNTFSNLVQGSLIAPVEKTISGQLDWARAKLTGTEQKYFARQGVNYAAGYIQSLPKAVKEFANVMMGKGGLHKPDIDFIPTSTSKLHQAYTTPLRLLEAADKFFMTLVRGGEMKALKTAGIEGAEAMKKADQSAQYRMFRQAFDPSGKMGQNAVLRTWDRWNSSINSLRQLPGGKWLVPFLQTPTNILKQGVEYSPLGITTVKGSGEPIVQLSKTIIGTAVFTSAYAMAKAGLTTWDDPVNSTERSEFYAAGLQPYSMKIGDKWVSYEKLGPLAYPMAMASAMKWAEDNNADSNTLEQIGAGMAGTLQFFADQSYMRSIGDTIDALRGDEFKQSRALANIPSQLIPYRALQGWIARQLDPVYRKAGGDGVLEKTVNSIKTQIPIVSKSLPVYETPFGEPSVRQFPTLNSWSPIEITKEQPEYMEYYQAKQEERRLNREAKKLEKQAEEGQSPIQVNAADAQTIKLPNSKEQLATLYKDALKDQKSYQEKLDNVDYESKEIALGQMRQLSDPEIKLKSMEYQNRVDYANTIVARIKAEHPEKVFEIELETYNKDGGAETKDRAKWAAEQIQSGVGIDKLYEGQVLTQSVVEALNEEYDLGLTKYNYGDGYRNIPETGKKAKKSGIKIAKPKAKKAIKLSTDLPKPKTIGYPKISAPKVKPFNIAKINTQIGTNKINTSIKKPGKLKVSFA